MKYTFKVKCIQTYVEDAIEYWTEGEEYECSTNDFIEFDVITNEGGFGAVGKSFATDFDEVFETDFTTNCPIPDKFLSREFKDRIYRDMWAENLKADIRARIEDTEMKFKPSDIDAIVEDIAYRWCWCGQYDCNLDYWSNIDSHLEKYPDSVL